IESRLGALGELADVRRAIETREQRDLELGRGVARLQSASVSALKSETDSLNARATEIAAASRRVEDTARAALERDATVEQRLGAIESRLGALGELADVRRAIETREQRDLGSEGRRGGRESSTVV